MSIDNVQDITPRSQYTLTAGQTVIPYPFPIFDQDDIVLDIDGVIKTITTHYTVSGVGADNGGNVTLVVAATGGETATVYRDTTIERTSDLQQNGPIRSSTYNDDMDRLHLILQELTLSDQRSIRVSQNDEVDFDDLELPAASSRASRFLIFDANGGVTTSAGTGADSGLRSDIASGATAAIIRVANIATLEALTGMSNDAIAQTLGYYTDNDGGHGTYRYDSTSTATVNGVTVVNAAGGVGRWLLLHQGYIDIRAGGAKGDDSTDNLSALNAIFTLTDIIAIIPKGTFKYTGNLSRPTCLAIIGESEFYSILKPSGASVTKALPLSGEGALRCSYLSGFRIDGSSVSVACTGLYIGDNSSSSWTGVIDRVRINGFSVSASVGCRIAQCLKAEIRHLYLDGNYDNLLVSGLTTDFPTSTDLLKLVSVNAVRYNEYVVNGETICHIQPTYDSAANEGVLVLPASGGICREIDFYSPRFEANYGSDTTKFQFRAGDGTALGGAFIKVTISNPHVAMTGATAKAFKFDGSAVNFCLRNPGFYSAVSGAISVTNSAYGEISEWQNTTGMTYDTVVSDTLNKVTPPQNAPWVDYTPTFASSVGDSATTFTATPTINVCRTLRRGRVMTVIFSASATLKAVTPSYITITVPTNITIQKDAITATHITEAGAGVMGLLAAEEPDNLIYIRRGDLANFGSGAALVLRGEISFEV